MGCYLIWSGQRYIGRSCSAQGLPHDVTNITFGFNRQKLPSDEIARIINSCGKHHFALVESVANGYSEWTFIPRLAAAAVPDLGPDFVRAFNQRGQSEALVIQLEIAAVWHLEDALILGGLSDDSQIDTTKPYLAAEQLCWLALLDNEALSLRALNALCGVLSRPVTPKEEITRLFKFRKNEFQELLKEPKSNLHKAKILEACSLLLDRFLSLHEMKVISSGDFHEKYGLWDLLKEFARLNDSNTSPDIAAWGAFALEKLKRVPAPVSKKAAFQEFEDQVKSLASFGASVASVQAGDVGKHGLKMPTTSLTNLGSKAGYLAPERKWAVVIDELKADADRAKQDPSKLTEMQQRIAIALNEYGSHSFLFFCIDILLEVAFDSKTKEIQNQACFDLKLPSLYFFYKHAMEQMREDQLHNSHVTSVRRALKRVKDAARLKKSKEMLWASPRLHAKIFSAYRQLQSHPNPQVHGEADRGVKSAQREAEAYGLTFTKTVYGLREVESAHIAAYERLLAQALEATAENPVIPPQTDLYISREGYLAKIDKELSASDSNVALLYGLPGQGKTQLAAAFARLKRYRHVYWCSATHQATLITELTHLAKTQGWISGDVVLKPENLFALVKREIEKRPNWLLVLDNVTKQDDLSVNRVSCLPQRGGDVVITSQSKQFGSARGIEVRGFEEGEALQLMQEWLSNADPSLCKDLAERLWCIPLLVSLTAASIATDSDLMPVNQALEKTLDDLARRPDELTQEHLEHEIGQRLELSCRAIEAKDFKAIEIVTQCSYLAPDHIPRAWFEKEGVDISRTLHLLQRYSLCQIHDEDSISMHGMVQLIFRNWDRSEHSKLGEFYSHLRDRGFKNPPICSYDDKTVETLSRLSTLAPHLSMMEKHADEMKVITKGRVEVLLTMGSYFYQQGLVGSAYEVLEKAYHLHGQLNLPEEGKLFGNLLLNLGNVYLAMNMMDLAEEAFRKLGSEDYMAGVYLEKGNFQAAIDCYSKSLENLEAAPSVIGETDKKYFQGHSYLGLGRAQRGLSNFADACASFLLATECFKGLDGFDCQAAACLLMRGEILLDSCPNTEAEALRSLRDAASILSKYADRANKILNCKTECYLSLALQNLGRTTEAQDCGAKAVELFSTLEEEMSSEGSSLEIQVLVSKVRNVVLDSARSRPTVKFEWV